MSNLIKYSVRGMISVSDGLSLWVFRSGKLLRLYPPECDTPCFQQARPDATASFPQTYERWGPLRETFLVHIRTHIALA